MSPNKKTPTTAPFPESVERLAALLDLARPVLQNGEPGEAATSLEDDAWSPKQRLGHLINLAVNHHQCIVRVMLDDLLSFPGFESDPWVQAQHFDEVSWNELAAWWLVENDHLLRLMRRIPESKYEVPCLIGKFKPVTLERLVAEYVKQTARHLKHLGIAEAPGTMNE